MFEVLVSLQPKRTQKNIGGATKLGYKVTFFGFQTRLDLNIHAGDLF